MPNRKQVELYKMVSGEEHLIESMSSKINFGVWNRFTIVFYREKITVYRQVGKIRQMEILFDVTDDGVARGNVGIATNGDAT